MGLFDLEKNLQRFKNVVSSMSNPNTMSDYDYVNKNFSISKAEEAANNLSIGRRLNALGDAFKGGDYYETADKYSDNIRDRYTNNRQNVRKDISDDIVNTGNAVANTAAMTNEFVNQSTVPEQIAAPALANQSVGLSNTGQVLANTLASNILPAQTQISENTAQAGTIANNQALKMNPKLLEGQNLLNKGKQLANETIGINNLTQGDVNKANLRALNLGNNAKFQDMKHANIMNPLLQNAQQAANTATNLANEQARAMNPKLLNLQDKLNAAQFTQNQIQRQIARGNNKAPFMLGGTAENNFKDGQVVRMNPMNGQIEIENVSPAIRDLYAAEEMKNYNASAAKSGAVKHPTRGGFITKSEQAADKTFAKKVGEHKPALVQNNKKVMNEIITRLDDEDLTGLSANPLKFFQSMSRLVDPDGSLGIAAIFDSTALDAQEKVAGVIQQQLRETLGAQFTQKEGMLLISRAYNPKLDESMNKQRLASWLNVMQLGENYFQQKVNWYNTYGTIAGFDQTGKLMAGVVNARDRTKTIMDTQDDKLEPNTNNNNAATQDNTSNADLSLDEIMSKYTTNG
tara:strand:+ start:5224 stop:6942 length:1719 start_codon:yes stop_codon:yes gene_type:complete